MCMRFSVYVCAFELATLKGRALKSSVLVQSVSLVTLLLGIITIRKARWEYMATNGIRN